jgi:YesN/AraC family two-component response regulator
MNILIDDDEPAVREVITRLLSMDGHTVTQAVSGAEGVTDFQRNEYDVVVTDQSMPGVDGHQLAVSVKVTALETPIVMISGFVDFDYESGWLPENIDYVIQKPVTVNQLRQALTAVTIARAS